jgi:hypothetical protein
MTLDSAKLVDKYLGHLGSRRMVHQIMLGIERSGCTLVKKLKAFCFSFARLDESQIQE